MDTCVMCGKELPTECGSMVCSDCMSNTVKYAHAPKQLPYNTYFSFNGGSTAQDFVVGCRRSKPLNKFQIWMFKVCFGIEARNV